MICTKCKVVDENIVIFAFEGKEPHRTFFNLFMEHGCMLCMSRSIKLGYRGKLTRPNYYANKFIDMIMLNKMKKYLLNFDNHHFCPNELCSSEIEDEDRFSIVPREDRYLVTVSEYFNTLIITDDHELYDSVNNSKQLKTICLRSDEAINRIIEVDF